MIFEIVLVFVFWIFTLYYVHRMFHKLSFLKKIHWAHHQYIFNKKGNLWNWKILFLYNDDIPSTIDTWLSEVVPTLFICWITGHWWLFLFFYIWAAFIQELIEHNPKINLYPYLTSGKWHLEHHKNWRCNYGLFTPIFDIVFNTNKNVYKK
jgi:sterol desaturase/sphingolipid hydroxylase (fatty acid hydroxylase superfamily)